MRLGGGAKPRQVAVPIEIPAHNRQTQKDGDHTGDQNPTLHAAPSPYIRASLTPDQGNAAPRPRHSLPPTPRSHPRGNGRSPPSPLPRFPAPPNSPIPQ